MQVKEKYNLCLLGFKRIVTEEGVSISIEDMPTGKELFRTNTCGCEFEAWLWVMDWLESDTEEESNWCLNI